MIFSLYARMQPLNLHVASCAFLVCAKQPASFLAIFSAQN